MRAAIRAEHGFSMVTVIAVMMIGGMLTAASFKLTNGDQPSLRASMAVKQAYAAAEAGLHYYLFHLAQDNQYWNKCTSVAPPGPGQPNPVNQQWDGSGADPRVWRSMPAGKSQYTIELLPVVGTACDPVNPAVTMIEQGTGMLRVRATGRAGGKKRSIVAKLRRRSFLDYLYFTDFETADPATYPASGSPSATWAQNNCVKYRAQRPSDCSVISFVNNGNLSDKINGPLHTNDDIKVCGAPKFGRTAADVVEVSGPAPGWSSSCSGSQPEFLGTWQTATRSLAMPPSNASLSALTQSAYRFTGTTTIRLTNSTMTVTNNGSTTTKSWPSNGLIYVKSGSCGTTVAPPLQMYTEASGCANVYVSGTYSQSLTIASEKDIIIRPPTGTANGDLRRSGDTMLGLIANNFVRVYHRVTRTSGQATSTTSCTNATPTMDDVTIDAAILSLSHSFIADNHACGGELGTLTINGAIAQRFRGFVGTFGSSDTGFSKDYTYDDRLRYREPPFFLEPVATAWRTVRQNEQVPAR